MRRTASLFLLLLLLTACAAPPENTEAPESPSLPQDTAPTVPDKPDEPEDRVLLTLEAPLSDGRTLTLEAVGKPLDQGLAGVREVRVLDGETLLQTVSAYEAIEMEWGSAADDLIGKYTTCWSESDVMEALDLNFDGNTDFGLFGWVPNNTIPYYYWTWDPKAEEYRYACTLQGAEAHPETGIVSTENKAGQAGSEYVRCEYRPDEDGVLYMTRREIQIFSQTVPNQDMNRPILETWLPREGVVIRPVVWYDGDLILTRREIPVFVPQADGTDARYTEIWEQKDGELQLTSRKEYTDDEQP